MVYVDFMGKSATGFSVTVLTVLKSFKYSNYYNSKSNIFYTY